MNADEVSSWFDGYNETFGAVGRGDAPVEAVLDFYDEAMLITSSDIVVGPHSGEAASWVRAQSQSLQAARYSHTDILSREVSVLNTNTALLKGDFSRRDSEGQEIAAFTVTYWIYRTGGQLRIGALALHSA